MEVVDPIANPRRSLLEMAALAAASFALPRRRFQARLEWRKAFVEDMGAA
jgi:hypothetical protein